MTLCYTSKQLVENGASQTKWIRSTGVSCMSWKTQPSWRNNMNWWNHLYKKEGNLLRRNKSSWTDSFAWMYLKWWFLQFRWLVSGEVTPGANQSLCKHWIPHRNPSNSNRESAVIYHNQSDSVSNAFPKSSPEFPCFSHKHISIWQSDTRCSLCKNSSCTGAHYMHPLYTLLTHMKTVYLLPFNTLCFNMMN